MAITLGANEPHHLGPNVLAILAAVIASALVAMTFFFVTVLPIGSLQSSAKAGWASSCGSLLFSLCASASRFCGMERVLC